MNAAVADIEDRATSLIRKIHGCERSWLESSLQNWGNWIEQHSDFEGYPRADAIASWLEGGGGGTRGHRILCLDMPSRVYAMHARVLLLGEDERAAIWAEYVPTVKEDGTPWTRPEKWAKLKLSERGYQDRLQRARLAILGIATPRT
jgi:hypothetical protein